MRYAALIVLLLSGCTTTTYLNIICDPDYPGATDWVTDPPGHKDYCEQAYGPWEEYNTITEEKEDA